MRIRRALASVYWAVSRWRYRLEDLPEEDAGILIGAPHTSNWDFLLMLGLSWQSGIRVKFLGKHQLFTGPLGPLMRALGGIPVDRRDPSRVVAEIVSRLEAGERFFLVVTPEGTRSRGAHWRSGFYRIAREADLTVTLGYVDRTTMTTGSDPRSGSLATCVRTWTGSGPSTRVRPVSDRAWVRSRDSVRKAEPSSGRTARSRRRRASPRGRTSRRRCRRSWRRTGRRPCRGRPGRGSTPG